MDWSSIIFLVLIGLFIFMKFRPVKGLTNLSAAQLKEKIANKEKLKIVDVREPHEFKSGHIKNAINIPLGRVPFVAQKELSKDDNIVVVCLSGGRSRVAAMKLKKQGFNNLYNLVGGMSAWKN